MFFLENGICRFPGNRATILGSFANGGLRPRRRWGLRWKGHQGMRFPMPLRSCRAGKRHPQSPYPVRPGHYIHRNRRMKNSGGAAALEEPVSRFTPTTVPLDWALSAPVAKFQKESGSSVPNPPSEQEAADAPRMRLYPSERKVFFQR